jgi:hypothetical protein
MARNDLLLEALGARADGGNEPAMLRPVLLRSLTELFVGARHHYPEEIRQFQEIGLLLIEAADEALRRFVAESLANELDAPPPLLERLVEGGGGAALVVLAGAINLPRETRAIEAAFGPPAHAAALAGRPDIDDELVALLCQRPELDVLSALVANPRVAIEGGTRRTLIARAIRAPSLARRLIERCGPTDELTPLFLAALPGERAAMILTNRRRFLGRPDPAAPPIVDEKIMSSLQQLALVQARPRFVHLLAKSLGLPSNFVAGLVDDPHGEPLALCLGALRVPAPAATRIFLFIDPRIGQSVERVRTLLRLVRDTPAPVCRAILARLAPDRRPARHETQHDQEAGPLAARPGPPKAGVRRPNRPGRETSVLPGPRPRRSTGPDRT